MASLLVLAERQKENKQTSKNQFARAHNLVAFLEILNF